MTSRFQPPSAFDFADSSSWPDWLERFEQYRKMTKLHKDDGDVQVATLLYCMGPQAAVVIKQLAFDDDADKDNFDTVAEKLTAHFKPVSNVVHERAMFERAAQQPTESVDEFLRRLHRIADKCDFKDARDDRIRDRFMANLLDTKLTLELQLLENADLTKATTHARNYEQVRQQVATQRRRRSVDAPPPERAEAAGVSYSSRAPQPGGSDTCYWCGHSPSHPRSDCPARREKCSACGKTGHFSHVCQSGRSSGFKSKATPAQRTAPAPSAHSVEERTATDTSGAYLFMGGVSSPITTEGPWVRVIQIGDTPVQFKVDTGADASIINAQTFAALRPAPALSPATLVLQGPDGSGLPLAGFFEVLSRSYDGEEFTHSVYVLTGSGANLLSRSASLRMGFVRPGVAGVTTTPQAAQELGCMAGPPVKIRLKADTRPYHCPVARRIPFPLHQKVKAELNRMVESGIIEPVTEPTEWCSPMVAVRKKNGDVRVCVDLKKLNLSVQRETFVLPTVDEIMAKLSGATTFTTLDTKKGFWQVPLAKESQHLTTFITPFGRFMFRRLPFGISSAPEIFQRRLMGILDGIEGVCVFMDDILIFGKTMADHDRAFQEVQAALQAARVTLNPDKSQLRQSSIKFLGHVIAADGVRPDPDRVTALLHLPPPTDVAGLRRALGLFNYLHKFLPDMASVSTPLRALLRNNSAWLWDAQQQAAFNELKSLAAAACQLSFYDPALPAVISADASSYGLGATLLQEHAEGLTPVAYASKSLNDTQRRYAQIEKELLAVTWACDHFSQYLLGGQPVTVQTDHKPLVPLVNTRDLDNVPLRCQRMLMRLLQYNATAVYVPGPKLVVADALSRAPAGPSDPLPHSSDLLSDVDVLVASVAAEYASPTFVVRLREATAADATLSDVSQIILTGWPTQARKVAPHLRPFFCHRASLSVADGCVYFHARLVIPPSMQAEVLRTIHAGHQGVSKSRTRACSAVWWPGLGAAIADVVHNCEVCSRERLAPQAPLQPQQLPDRPWQRIAADLFAWEGKEYLLTVDYFSRFIEVDHLRSTTSSAVITALDAHFSRYGLPETLVSDNGPQFASEQFAVFSAKHGITHRTSSPRHPQSNGMAERAVRTVKEFLRKGENLQAGLLAYRSTPLRSGSTPAQLLMGRHIRSQLPRPTAHLEPAWPDLAAFRQREKAYKDAMADDFDDRHRVRPPPPLSVGDRVWVVDLGREGTIKTRLSERSFLISTAQSEVRRNVRNIRPLPKQQDEAEDPPPLDAEVPPVPVQNPAPQPDGRSPTPSLEEVDQDQPAAAESGQPAGATTRSGRAVKPPQRLNL